MIIKRSAISVNNESCILDFYQQLFPRYDALREEITNGKLAKTADLSFVKTFQYLTKLIKRKKGDFSDTVHTEDDTTQSSD